jgi:hypothetical protein
MLQCEIATQHPLYTVTARTGCFHCLLALPPL